MLDNIYRYPTKLNKIQLSLLLFRLDSTSYKSFYRCPRPWYVNRIELNLFHLHMLFYPIGVQCHSPFSVVCLKNEAKAGIGDAESH